MTILSKMPIEQFKKSTDKDPVPYDIFDVACTTRQALTRIADKWTVLLLMALAEKPYYFGELRRKVSCISQKMLTQTLRKLETDNLIQRDVQPGSIIKVSYRLTPLGKSLIVPLQALQDWAIDHGAEMGGVASIED